MFIRPVGVTVKAANRPAGRPLLRGLLRRAAGAAEWAQAEDSGEAVVEGFGDEYGDEFGGRVGDEFGHRVGDEFGERVEDGEPREESPWEGAPGPAPTAEEEPQPAPAAPALPGSLVAELKQLADLTREGLLTPEEFSRAKARLLGGGGRGAGS
ncbi:hypothetical protein ACFW6V_20415 [Streptomyces sp. NPDC058734]|uniref:hypothetical protein n=1 Tax=Streptomyces sp. NPDC058734 TaxID=3346615 RepID=UPI0036BC4A3D